MKSGIKMYNAVLCAWICMSFMGCISLLHPRTAALLKCQKIHQHDMHSKHKQRHGKL